MTFKRRDFVGSGVVAICLPSDGRAQVPNKVARIGWLGTPWGMSHKSALAGFRGGMRDLGWVEGRDFVLDLREGERDQAAAFATELLRAKADIIVTQGPMIQGARAELGATPVVFAFSGDVVAAGLVASLAHPGGGMTGVTAMSVDLVGKRLELLKEALPAMRRVAILANPAHPGEPLELIESQAAARRLGVSVQYLPVRSLPELELAFEAMQRERAEGLLAFPDASINRYAKRIAEFSVRRRVPAISGFAEFAEAGNLMSYGPNFIQLWRRIASYVDRLLKGAKPSELPVEQPTSFELVINLVAAKALGLSLPQGLLLRADEVIR